MEEILKVDKWHFKIMNTFFEYNLKTQINLIFPLTSLHNFINNYLSQNFYYVETENHDSIILYNRINNLFLNSSLVTFTQMNKKRNTILYTM